MSKELPTVETPQQLYDVLLRTSASLQASVGLRLLLTIGLAGAGQLTSGPLAMALICLCLVATIATIWSVVELVACRWVSQLMAFRELILPRDAVLALAEAALLAEPDEVEIGNVPVEVPQREGDPSTLH